MNNTIFKEAVENNINKIFEEKGDYDFMNALSSYFLSSYELVFIYSDVPSLDLVKPYKDEIIKDILEICDTESLEYPKTISETKDFIEEMYTLQLTA